MDKESRDEPMPPKGITPEQAEKWWREQLNTEGKGGISPIPEKDERQCGYCGALNPCTPKNLQCGQCNHSLRNAKRVKVPIFSTNQY